MLPISKFSQAELKYNLISNNLFIHNYDRDLQFFILWERGRLKEKEVMEILNNEFNILYVAEIHWSEEFKRANFNRLYSQPNDSKLNLQKHINVGMGAFLCIVFEDLNPKYQYLKSLSGDIFIGNKNAVSVKYEIRKLLGGNLIHGTSGISEFFHQSSLIFHQKILNEILHIKKWDGNIKQLHQDLAGAYGWQSFEEFFSVLNLSVDWVVLRNHEYLPNDFWGNDDDIDLLCDNLTKFISAANATKRKGGISAYETIIEDKKVFLDIRYVGDNYYNSVWEYQMLQRKKYKHDLVPILRDDDYFFSLLFHAKLQKSSVKELYIPRLLKLAESIGFENINEDDILNDKKAANILNGYLNEQRYYFSLPNDSGVYLNKSVYQYINAHPLKNKVTIKRKVIKLVAKLTPSFLKSIIPKRLKFFIKRII